MSQSAVTIGPDGLGLIVYHDEFNGDLKVAHCTNVACTAATLTPIDRVGFFTGTDASVTIGADGLGLISYRHYTDRHLKVAHCTTVSCTAATLTTHDTTGNVGLLSSVTIGADGLGLISYLDSTNGGLKVAHCSNVACEPPVPPEAPTNLMVASVVGNTVTITWAPPFGGPVPTNYLLEGGVAPGEVLASIPTGSATPSYTFVAPTGAFYIRVHALAGVARSAPSNEIRIFVNVPGPPAAPASLLGLVNGSTVHRSWTPAATGGPPTGLVLDVSGALAVSLPLPLSESFSYAGVPAGTYTFHLRALNGSGASAPSNPVTLTFPASCSGVPDVPVGFVAAASGNTITVPWAPPANGAAVTGYTLLVTGALVGNFTTTGRVLAGTVGAGSYTLSVRAENPCGAGAATPTQTIVIS